MTQEALKLALEALEGFYEYGYDRQECFEHITAIKEALAQPEQEPVQCKACFGMGFVDGKGDQCLTCNGTGEQPPQRTERNFCERCGKRTKDIHTCTPPQENT